MGYDLTVQGLLRKHAELANEVESLRAQLHDKLSALDHIGSAARILRPDIELEDLPEGIVAPPLTGTRGEFQRFLLDALRKANAPQSTFDLADKVMAERGLNAGDRIALGLIRKRTGYALAKLRKAGKVVSRQTHRSAPLAWCIPQN